MEQYSQYLMMVKKNMNPSYSWEEEAFAEDARGPFVWPPRSYSCSFCRREFKSAQALGGHMNVHRREKAKLKQTTIAPQNNTTTTTISRVSSIALALGHQESVDHSINSDTKSCVYDEEIVGAHGNGDVETNLVLGFDLDSRSNAGSGSKKRKIGVIQPILAESNINGLDLELRLAR